MNNISLNHFELSKWIMDRGDYTHNINYNLNQNSSIMDLGGYTGVWAQQMIEKYSPNVYIIEPVPKFYNFMVSKFENNPKVKLLNVGVATENREGKILVNQDASSSNLKNGEEIDVKFKTIEQIFKQFNIENIDLIQINIEGDEYSLLERMIQTKFINRFKNIQIQFHLGIEDDISRREDIQKNLILNGFKNKFNYPFVWECWTKE
jgi:FkbM family methyltransferase